MNALPQIPLEGVIETPFLAQKAGAIRALAKNVARDIAEIGRHLTEAKAACKHGEWGQWLDVEFAWSDRTAQKYMQVFKMASNTPCVADLDVPVGALIDLSAPSTPAAAIEEAIARAEAGETLTRADVDAMIAKAKAEAASRAKQLLGGQTSLIADLEATMPIDDKTGSKPIRKMFEREFYKALCRREESLRRETAQTQRMRATYEAFRPIWREHPEWTVEQCDEEYRRREMEAVAQATG